jgi:hypothetical protein
MGRGVRSTPHSAIRNPPARPCRPSPAVVDRGSRIARLERLVVVVVVVATSSGGQWSVVAVAVAAVAVAGGNTGGRHNHPDLDGGLPVLRARLGVCKPHNLDCPYA